MRIRIEGTDLPGLSTGHNLQVGVRTRERRATPSAAGVDRGTAHTQGPPPGRFLDRGVLLRPLGSTDELGGPTCAWVRAPLVARSADPAEAS